MTRHYCTVFDSNYLAKGIAMIRSLKKHSPHAAIHVLAMDDKTFDVLGNLELTANYSMAFFEDRAGVGELRKTRTHQEFCWSCGAIFTEFISKYQRVDITYVDADTFFFSDPEVVFDEIGDKSIGITPHRFAKADEARLLPNGKYAVQWATFRGEVGRKCLSKWASQVREWCFYRHEDGKFGDQKYLDTWPTDYPGEVCEIANPGVGLAPWNVENYDIGKYHDEIVVGAKGETSEYYVASLVLYHFHEYLHGDRLTNWPLSQNAKDLIYAPYIKAIEEAQQLINGTLQAAK